jgi:hypothetical protein
MAFITMERTVDKKYFEKYLTYEDYILLVEDLLKNGKVTGVHQSPELTEYGKLNHRRMLRIHKSVVVSDEIKAVIEKIEIPQTWVVLTESWCGDAAQIVPVLDVLARFNKNIELKVLLRDENAELMDQYLTNGKSRSIPKLIVIETASTKELFHWGPRPAVTQKLMNMWVADEMPFEEMKEELHLWYAKDRTVHIQQELKKLLEFHL